MAYTNSSLVTYKRLTKNRTSPRNHKIDTITIHCFVGQVTAKQGCDYFATTDRECSSNYVVGKDGSIGLSVEEKNCSWCSSNSANDNRAITIEVACDTKVPYKVTDKAYKALIELVADICKRNGIKKLLWKADKSLIGQVSKQNMTVHRWFANKACPGEYLYERHTEIAKKVNAILSAETKTTSKTKTPSATDTAQTVWDFLMKKGLNAYAVAGIMGNLKAESGLNPKNLQNTYEKSLGYTDSTYTKAVDNGTYKNFVKDSAGYGLAQWTYYTRKQNLLDYARSKDKSIGDLTMQLEFFWKELQGYKSVMSKLKSAKSVKEASDAVLTGYEKPQNQSDSVKKARAEYGKAYYKKFVKSEFTASEAPYQIKVTASVLNIRKDPTTNSAITGTIKDKGTYTIVEVSDGVGATKWGKLKSGAGWISLDYTKKV